MRPGHPYHPDPDRQAHNQASLTNEMRLPDLCALPIPLLRALGRSDLGQLQAKLLRTLTQKSRTRRQRHKGKSLPSLIRTEIKPRLPRRHLWEPIHAPFC